MKKHVRIYLKFFGYLAERFEDLYIPCEMGCGRAAVDINHIEPRGMGGSKLKDFIENLMAMCRKCHDLFERKLISKEEAMEKHLLTLK